MRWLAILLALLWAIPAQAGVTRDGTGNGGGNTSSSSPTTITLGSHTNNDVCLIAFSIGDNVAPTITPASGWTQLGTAQQVGTANVYAGLFYHVWLTGDTTTPSFSDNAGAGQDRNWITICYSGENTSTPFDPNATPSQGGAGNPSTVLSAVVPTNSPDMLVGYGDEFTSGGGSPSSSWTSPLTTFLTEQAASSWVETYLADGALAASGSTGSKTFTATAATHTGAFMIAIQPAPAGAGQKGWVFAQ